MSTATTDALTTPETGTTSNHTPLRDPLAQPLTDPLVDPLADAAEGDEAVQMANPNRVGGGDEGHGPKVGDEFQSVDDVAAALDAA